MAGFSICDDRICREAAKQEIIRRYFQRAVNIKKGLAGSTGTREGQQKACSRY